MELDFWHERWEQNQIGFHMPTVNPHLIEYWSQIVSDQGKVFVPLCGKTLDLLWLKQQGHPVIAVECSDRAINDFFSENKLDYESQTNELFNIYSHESISIFQGDFFSLKASDLIDTHYVFDRASLVALPEDMRLAYARHMADILGTGARVLLITLEYNQSSMQGPPFSVKEQEVNTLYGEAFSIKKLAQQDIIQQEDRFRNRGLDSLIETVFCLQRL